MTGIEWLIAVMCAGWGLVWIAGGIADHRHGRRPLPRIAQAAPQVPPLPPTRPRPDLPRARDIRRSRARHRAPQGGTE